MWWAVALISGGRTLNSLVHNRGSCSVEGAGSMKRGPLLLIGAAVILLPLIGCTGNGEHPRPGGRTAASSPTVASTPGSEVPADAEPESRPPAASEQSVPEGAVNGTGAADSTTTRPSTGVFRYRTQDGRLRAFAIESVNRHPDGWRVQVNNGGTAQSQLWGPKGMTLVSEQVGRSTCFFDPPLVLQPASLAIDTKWSSTSECRVGDSDSYMVRTIEARVTERAILPVMDDSREAWAIQESIRTVLEARPPEGLQVQPTRSFQSTDEVTQRRAFSIDLQVALTVDGHRRFTNVDGSMHEGDFRYELIEAPA